MDVGSKVMESVVSNLNAHNDYLQRKLDHYNKWLCDPARPVGSGPYPGFPEDVKLKAGVAKLQAEAKAKVEAKAAKPKAEKAPKVKRARKAEGPTKQERAVELYKRLNGSKVEVIQAIQTELGMSLAGATTYFYNAKKLA
jgi:ribosomal protein L7/L12